LLTDLAVVVDIFCDEDSVEDVVVKAKQKQRKYFVINSRCDHKSYKHSYKIIKYDQ
jgi:hypothetical protein